MRRALWLLVVMACSNDFEKQSQLRRVRVLAVKAEPAELTIPSTGLPQPVQLEALAWAPEGRPVTVKLALCRPFANVYAADFECPGKDGVDLVDGGLSLLDPAVLGLFMGGVDAGADPLADPVVAGQLAQGFSLQVGYLATDGTQTEAGTERGYATVTLRKTDTPNHNPSLIDVQLVDGGVSLEGQTLDAGTVYEVTPVLGPGSMETYVEDGGEVPEAISFTWYATGPAAVDSYRSVALPGGQGKATTNLTTPDGGTATTTVWVVARDGRGGVGWLSRTFSSN